MNYRIRPRFFETITQQPKENIPIVSSYFMSDDLNLDELADYNPEK
jgi:hypothetical protein